MSIKYFSQEKLERAKAKAGPGASEAQILEAYKLFGGAFEGNIDPIVPAPKAIAPKSKGRSKKK